MDYEEIEEVLSKLSSELLTKQFHLDSVVESTRSYKNKVSLLEIDDSIKSKCLAAVNKAESLFEEFDSQLAEAEVLIDEAQRRLDNGSGDIEYFESEIFEIHSIFIEVVPKGALINIMRFDFLDEYVESLNDSAKNNEIYSMTVHLLEG